MASTYSSVMGPRWSKGTSSAANSPCAMPTPNVTVSRPPDMTSSVEIALANVTGWCTGSTMSMELTRIRVVAPAMNAMAVSAWG